MSKKKKLKAVCRTCGSVNVLCDAYAEWSVRKQSWEVASTFDKGAYCNDCEGETRIDVVPVK